MRLCQGQHICWNMGRNWDHDLDILLCLGCMISGLVLYAIYLCDDYIVWQQQWGFWNRASLHIRLQVWQLSIVERRACRKTKQSHGIRSQCTYDVHFFHCFQVFSMPCRIDVFKDPSPLVGQHIMAMCMNLASIVLCRHSGEASLMIIL